MLSIVRKLNMPGWQTVEAPLHPIDYSREIELPAAVDDVILIVAGLRRYLEGG